MSFTEFQERLARSIKVLGLPKNYDKDDILNNLKNAGVIEDIKLGSTEMIVTYSTANEKDLSRMYDGCPVGDYVIKLEDPISFEVNSESEPKSPEKVEAKNEYDLDTTNQNEVQVQSPQHKPETQSFESPKVEKPQPIITEPVREENTFVKPTEEPQITQTPSKQELHPERKVEQRAPLSTFQGSGQDNSKELLRDLQNTNLPARAGLPASDLFKTVTNKNYLLLFTMIWGLQLFLRSLF